VEAAIRTATVTTTSGLTKLDAINDARATSSSLTVAASVGIVGISGAGSSQDIAITTSTKAEVDASTLTLTGGLQLLATDTSRGVGTVDSWAAAGALIGFAAAGARPRSSSSRRPRRSSAPRTSARATSS
jgi:hypothetical protein